MLQRTMAQLPGAPQLPLPHFPLLPGVPAMPWEALHQLNQASDSESVAAPRPIASGSRPLPDARRRYDYDAVSVTDQEVKAYAYQPKPQQKKHDRMLLLFCCGLASTGWLSVNIVQDQDAADVADDNAGKLAGPIEAAQEWRALWGELAGHVPWQATEMPPPASVHTRAAPTEEEVDATPSQLVRRASSRASDSESVAAPRPIASGSRPLPDARRRYDYDVVSATDQEAKAHAYQPKLQQKKHDRMLLLLHFGLPETPTTVIFGRARNAEAKKEKDLRPKFSELGGVDIEFGDSLNGGGT
ncbi:spt3 dosage dependent suppressor of ty-induced promoter mutations-like protein [Lentinula edodes]|uniref:Spt3 dosage dependent suppressor of ty-induced promoter mutations-like protein n=1 Tax=Lentinula edodes TaxID=5353 RepID=A0A1Q3ER26_LENED|nr:spt3 dosage dependent suppressor of ty-induced promoter mutations-like protein [Lentinula edodes]